MSRFFFNLYEDLDTLDDQGLELADRDAAEGVAIKNARILAADAVMRTRRLNLEHRLEVVDEQGALVRTVMASR